MRYLGVMTEQAQTPETTPTDTNGVKEPHVDDLMVNATRVLRSWMEAFNRTASLVGFPAQIPQGFLLMFPMALSIANMEANNQFHCAVLDALMEIVQRTRATDGGLDPKAIQDEMERRRFAVAMGPDNEILQRLVMEQNAVQARQGREIAALRGQLKQTIDSVLILSEAASRADGTEKDWTEMREGIDTLLSHLVPPEKKPDTVGVGEGL